MCGYSNVPIRQISKVQKRFFLLLSGGMALGRGRGTLKATYLQVERVFLGKKKNKNQNKTKFKKIK